MAEWLNRLTAALGGRYAFERQLGAGGMATVYLARDLKHDRNVAIKVLRPELAAVLGAERFLQEIKVTATLQHPHILPLHDSGEAASLLYYVTPFVEGESLRQKLIREKQLTIGESVAIATAVASALDYAHRHGVVHRDIKPENILLQDNHAVVADFGIALAIQAAGGSRLTETGMAVGTVGYMSPEQATADRTVDARSDVYSLAVTLYEMLTGDPPFTGSTAQAVMAKVLAETPTPPRALRETVPDHVDKAVRRALAKVPADRFASAAEFRRALSEAPPFAASRRRGWPAQVLGVVAVVIVIVAAIVVPRLVTTRAVTPVATANAERPSIAVLPFRDMSPQGDQLWFGEGLSEEILSALTRLPGLRVVARTSSFSLRDAPIAVIGDSLAVTTVLEGSVRRDGNQVRIQAQLVNVADQGNLWSRTFQAELTNVFDVQDSIARAIVTALQVELSTGGPSALIAASTANPEAHEQYLRGRYRWNQRNEPGVLAAIGHFRRAVELDSTYATAWAGLADAYLVLPEYSPTASPELVRRESEAAAARAMALNRDLPAALTSAAWSRLIHHYDWDTAEDLLEQAISIDSTSVGALHWMSHVLSWQGRHDEALAFATRAVAVDPLSPLMHANLSWILMEAGDYDAAIERDSITLRLDPQFLSPFRTMWDTYWRAGLLTEATEAWMTWVSRTNRDLGASERVAESMRRFSSGDGPAPLPQDVVGRLQLGSELLGQIYAMIGDTDASLDALERAYLERSGSRSVLSMKVNPAYDALRDDPRFVELLQRVGLAPS